MAHPAHGDSPRNLRFRGASAAHEKGAGTLFGSRGYLGFQLMEYFKSQCIEIDGYDLPSADVTSESFWRDFDPAKYSAILFFAGLTGTKASNENASLFIAVNEGGLGNLLNRIKHLGQYAPRIIFPSSRLVYKGANVPLKESAAKETLTVYARNKLNCERLLAESTVPFVVLRICVPYGNIVTRDYSYGTIGFMERQAKEGRITLFGDGSLRRTFTFAGDILW